MDIIRFNIYDQQTLPIIGQAYNIFAICGNYVRQVYIDIFSVMANPYRFDGSIVVRQ